MLRDYKLAHSIYDLLRTDYSNDKAWTHHAAAHEMTVLSLLLLPTPITTKTRADTITPYLDLAVYSYVNRCSALFPALRCLLVAVELLRARGGGAVDDAARWAVRALDLGVLGKVGEAVVTERVGDVYASRKGAGPTGIGGRGRKAAMWRMLAAREWVQAGRAAEARRCLDMALPVYGGVAGVWEEVEGFVRGLVEAAGYGVGEGDAEDGEVETEALEMGMKRMSVISPPVGKVAGVDVDEGEEKKRDDFVQS